MERIRILLVEDDQVDQMAFERLVRREDLPYDYEIAGSVSSARKALAAGQFDAALIDYLLGDGTAFDLFDEIEDTPIIMITGSGDEKIAVQAMKDGAADYLIKDPAGNYLTTLPATVENATSRWRAEAELKQYRERLEELVKERTAALQQEISERVRAEEALKKYSERLEDMVDARTRELREAQQELIRKEKLATLGQLAGGVAHELRNPLGAIKNAAYFLNMVLEEPDPEVKTAMEIIDKEMETSEKIINSLLDFAHPTLPLQRQVNVNHVIQEALSRTVAPENVEVMAQLDEALPSIQADPRQLGQVFDNLILNAVQAMTLPSPTGTPEGGQLNIQTLADSVEPSLVSSKWVVISFSDTGVGIPPKNLDKLFEPLFTTKAKGIGLGLAMVKAIVEGHGGRIEVKSQAGKGSTFSVKLPISQNETAGPVLSHGDAPQKGTKTS